MSKARCQVRVWFVKTLEVEGSDAQTIQTEIKRSIHANLNQIYSWEDITIDVVTVEVVQLDKGAKQ
jgi:hypothetical protein